jgi:DNA invertase Pin-like site-specific DNA recombinase
MSGGIAFYLRISMADGDLGKDNKDESNSIENQRELLKSFIEADENFTDEVFEYIDDGYTGTNFNRPAFRRMIDDAKKGRIHTIIVKDLSRLGRDYIGVGDYLEQIFPVLGVRFIALNSNYDSNKYIGKTMGLDMAVNNLVNSMYSRDISKKVKAGFRSRWQQGYSTTGRVPYGYIKDKSAKGGWCIDAEAAKIIRLIFEKACEGWNTKQIVEYLNEHGIATPGTYAENNKRYGGHRKVPDSECLWDIGKVKTIICRYEYTGAFVHSKRENVQVGSHITRKVPEHKQIVIEDGHDAIISKELFDKAQQCIRYIKKPSFKMDNQYALRGKARCGVCRLALSRLELSYGAAYSCSHKMSSGSKSMCCDEYIPAGIVESAVLHSLKTQLKIIRELGLHLEERERSEKQNRLSDTRQLESEIEILKAERIRQYEAYADGVIGRDEYLTKKSELTEKIETLQDSLDRLRLLLEQGSEIADGISNINEKSAAYMGYDTLTKEMVDAFIGMVYVYDEHKIEVEFLFDDLLKTMAEKIMKVEDNK